MNYKKLVEVADVLYGYPCDATAFNDAGKGLPLARIRDVLAGRTNTYTTEIIPENYIISNGDLLVGMDGNFHVATWKMSRSILCQRVCRISSKDDAVVYNGFLNHILPPIIKEIEQNKQSGTVKHLLAKDINAICIPLPPLAVQQEIVRILDSFTELTAELTARRKQYEHYRDELLTFGDEVPCYSLSSICDIVDYRGKTPKKTESGIFLVTAKNIRKGYIDYEKSQEFISRDDYSEVMRRGLPQIGDVLITTEAPCGNVAQVDRENIALAQRVIKYRPKNELLDSTYLKYILLGKDFQSKLDVASTGGTVKGIKGSRLHALTIPVPSIEKQKQIVSILSRFEVLCSDLTSGLPAEIAVRQKQYEYYRDKLLTFKEKME